MSQYKLTEKARNKAKNDYKKFISKKTDDERKQYERERKRKYRAAKKEAKEKEKKQIQAKCKDADKDTLDFLVELSSEIKTLKNNDLNNKKEIKKTIKKKVKTKVAKVCADTTCDKFKELILSGEASSSTKYKTVSEKTVNARIRTIKRIYKQIYSKEFNCDNWDWLKNKRKVENGIKSIKSWKSATSITQAYSTIAFWLRYLGEEYQELQKYYSNVGTQRDQERQAKKGKNKMPGNYKEDYIRYDDLLALNPKAEKSDIRTKLIYNLFVKIAPRRSQDYSRMIIGQMRKTNIKTGSKNINYLILNTKGVPVKLFIQRYKGKAQESNGDYERKLSPGLSNVFAEYIKKNKKNVGEFLFFNSKKKPEEMTEKQLTKQDQKFGKLVSGAFLKLRGLDGSGIKNKFGINHARHSYASWLIPYIENEDEGKKIATDMGSSLNTLRREYVYVELRRPQ